MITKKDGPVIIILLCEVRKSPEGKKRLGRRRPQNAFLLSFASRLRMHSRRVGSQQDEF